MSSLQRYRLDDLGWYQFEWLIQVVLKASVGLGVESWGGSHDGGKDAFYPGSLRFPAHEISPGPFVFQAKFIQSANAAGAQSARSLLNSVRNEAVRIGARQRAGEWAAPKQYVLYTNAPIDRDLREKIREMIGEAQPGCLVSPFGGADVCDLLDIHPVVKRGFPQLLGLRDLDELIGLALNKRGREKSQAAIAAAREIAPMFVPTLAHRKAREVLVRHHFVVLEGPPEMGKTAIAWMLALQQAAEGWEAIVCDDPDDVYSNYDREVRQVFIADDAFGRTEYDVGRGRRWEQELPRVLPKLNSTHWLIWVTTYLADQICYCCSGVTGPMAV
jgi:hypothetical protein